MTRLATVLTLAFATLVIGPGPAAGQTNGCVDCHLTRPDAPGADHVADWDRSPHRQASVGCDRCHGGNPAAFEAVAAHRGMLPFGNPASPIARQNVPGTCGRCHSGPYVAFQQSRHYELLRGGDPNVPTCTTCHDAVAANRPSPRQLEARCATCHGAGRTSPNPDLPPEGRLMLEGIRDARTLLQQANGFIARMPAGPRRTSLEDDARQAGVPLTEATNAGHAFVFAGLQERLTVARERISALYARLVGADAR